MSLPPKLSPEDVEELFQRVDVEVDVTKEELEYAYPIVEAAGLTIGSSILDSSFYAGNCSQGNKPLLNSQPCIFEADASSEGRKSGDNGAMDSNAIQQEAAMAANARRYFNPLRGSLSAFPLVLSTTGGHSNTDHIVAQAADGSVDKFCEYKRRMRRRVRLTQLEERRSDRWDMPRVPGGRRRRIKRDNDSPAAPVEPPLSGYVLYVSQMTTKLRHDNPKRLHNQVSAVRRISKMWNSMPDEKRQHYVQLVKDAREEYAYQLREYRATGGWKPAKTFERLGDGNGPWVRIPYEEKNDLEKEIDTYDQVVFPPRPPELNADYEERLKKSIAKRKERRKLGGRKYY